MLKAGPMSADKFCDFLIRASIPLRALGENDTFCGIASGCLADYFGKQWLLTAAHISRKVTNWAVESEFDRARNETRLYLQWTPLSRPTNIFS